MAPIPAQPAVNEVPDANDGLRPQAAHRGSPAFTGADVRAALAALSAEHRQVIVEIYYHHRSVTETAVALGIHPSSVISLAYSAVRQLPQALAAAAAAASCSGRVQNSATALLASATSAKIRHPQGAGLAAVPGASGGIRGTRVR
jgi:RNA polymerase sigma-70 factor, ECF subfamily